MGTSTNYNAPPSWKNLKSDVTRAANNGPLSANTINGLLKSFIEHNGGARGISHGSGGNGSGSRGTVASGRAARKVAGNLGGFISDVGRIGLVRTFEKYGWTDLVGRTVKDILSCLLDRLGGNSSHIDEVDARTALWRLQEKYFIDAETIEELEQRLTAQVDQLDILLQDFFRLYMYEVFCRAFYGQLVQKIGDLNAQAFLGEIASFINATLDNRMVDTNYSQVDWAGEEGEAITSDIMETTLMVFGGESDT